MPLRRYILDSNGNPQPCDDLFAWAKWMEEADRRLAKTEVRDGCGVATHFIGIDHNFFDEEGGPILWETVVFGGDLSGDGERYSSNAEAVAGHDRWVKKAASAEDR